MTEHEAYDPALAEKDAGDKALRHAPAVALKLASDAMQPKRIAGLIVTVCDKCLSAECWQGEFMCDDAQGAGSYDLPISVVRALNERGHAPTINALDGVE